MADTPIKSKPAQAEAPYSAGTPSTGYQRPPLELQHDPKFKAATAAAVAALGAGTKEAVKGLIAGATVHKNYSQEFGIADFKMPKIPPGTLKKQLFTPEATAASEPPKQLQGGTRRRLRRRRLPKKIKSILNKIGPKNSSKITLKNIKALMKYTKKSK